MITTTIAATNLNYLRCPIELVGSDRALVFSDK